MARHGRGMPTLERKRKGVRSVKEQGKSISHTNKKEQTTSGLSEEIKEQGKLKKTIVQQNPAAWVISEESERLWEESRQRIKKGKQLYIERAKQLGEGLDATLVAITGFPPGIDADPAVYRSNQDEAYFMVAGKKGEVASVNDPEEVQKQAKRLYSVPLDSIGDYVIVRFDFKRRIEEDGLFYTPAGYIDGKRYDPKTDPPIIPT